MIHPFQSNRGSFLELLAAWFSGTTDDANNYSIVLAHLPAGSRQWSNASLISPSYSNQNRVLFMDKLGAASYLYHSQQLAAASGSTELGNKEDHAQSGCWQVGMGVASNVQIPRNSSPRMTLQIEQDYSLSVLLVGLPHLLLLYVLVMANSSPPTLPCIAEIGFLVV